MITLRKLLKDLPQNYTVTGDADTVISAPVVEADAELASGGVFVARIGLSVDGHDFIPRAVEKGAAAIIGERPRAELLAFDVPYVQVEDAQQATGYLAAAYHDHPSRKLIVIGVTGTDGKTTTSTLIHRILQIASDRKTGLVSTIAAEIGSKSVDTGFHVTTPSAPQIQAFLAEMVANGMKYAVLEMTSHGLAQGRLNGVDIDAAVLTNLTHEHMDYHQTFENYRAAKGRMFAMLGTSYRKPKQAKISVINGDDANAGYFKDVSANPTHFNVGAGLVPPTAGEASLAPTGGDGEIRGAERVITYGIDAASDVRGTDIIHQPGYTQFVVHFERRSQVFHLPLVGRFNVYNALAAITLTRTLGVQIEVIQRGLLSVTAIPGRMERVDLGQPYIALVDFAHTPNALEKALTAARTMTTGRVISVFGCAGLRDRDKRHMMPETAVKLADFSIFTAEDPRTESLDEILQTMANAATVAGGVEGKSFIRVRDRGQALYEACQRAGAGDVVIACGKGHEQSMAFGKTEYLWDDRRALRAAINGTPLKTLPTAEWKQHAAVGKRPVTRPQNVLEFARLQEETAHSMLDLGIVILNWNTRDLLQRCLETVYASQGDITYQVVVVDNSSTDGSAAMVREHFPQATLIARTENDGYSAGNNVGLRALGFKGKGNTAADAPRYALLLNPDTEVPPGVFAHMVAWMDSRTDVGAAGVKLVLPDGSLDKACRRAFPTPKVSLYHFSGLGKVFPNSPRFARYNMTYLSPDVETEVDSVVGAYMQVRREALDAVGLLDEVFFMYGEDLDWAFRIKSAGWKIVYHPQVAVKHVKRAASRQSQKAQLEFSRAMLIFYRKHYRATTPLWLHSLIMMGLLMKGGRGVWTEMRHPIYTP